MERDIEIIRGKVRKHDTLPVSWNKSGSWDRIRGHRPSRRPFPFHAVAAALLLLLLFVADDGAETQTPKVSDPALSEAQHQPDRLPAPKEAVPASTEIPPMVEPKRKNVSDKLRSSPGQTVISVQIATREAIEPSVPDLIKVPSTQPSARNDTVMAAVAETRAIAPVLGIIPHEEEIVPEMPRRKKRKLELKLRDEKISPLKTTDATFVIARIK